MPNLKSTVRVMASTWVICCGVYVSAIWGVGRLTPATAEGSLIRDASGQVIGSKNVAQGFANPAYFWSRPSASGYAAEAAAGSNLSPDNPKLTERAKETLKRYSEEVTRAPVPADLVAASGSGLDPHITEEAALYQAARVARARGLTLASIEVLIQKSAFAPGGAITPDRIVNVLELNIALDRLWEQSGGNVASAGRRR